MQIDQLLKPINPPAGGLLKLQQAIQAKTERRSSPSWRWQTALVFSVGLLWLGNQFSGQDSHLQSDDLTLATLELAATVKPADTEAPQSNIVELPGSNAQVKMYWLMADG